MSTLAERLQRALAAKPGATQAELARYCKAAGPSVSDWFRGETRSLRAQTLVLAAEYLGVRARWLLDGSGRMDDAAAPSPPAAPDLKLAEALPVVLEAIAACPEREELRQLLPLLVTGAHGYRERITELLTRADNAIGKRRVGT